MRWKPSQNIQSVGVEYPAETTSHRKWMLDVVTILPNSVCKTVSMNVNLLIRVKFSIINVQMQSFWSTIWPSIWVRRHSTLKLGDHELPLVMLLEKWLDKKQLLQSDQTGLWINRKMNVLVGTLPRTITFPTESNEVAAAGIPGVYLHFAQTI